MEHKQSERHYHIRWSNSNVDWKRFETSEEANNTATNIKRPGESYIVEAHSAECEHCSGFKAKAARIFGKK